MQKKEYQTHIANGRVETSASSGVGTAGPQP